MFTKTQTKVLLGCVLAYTVAYIARLNLSAVLPELTSALSLSGAQSGLFQTVFAISYAVGQLVNGAIADKVRPRLHMLTGLCLSALCNVLMGCLTNFSLMVLCWGVNGLAQSMLWTPIVRLVALYFKDRAREKASFALSFTLVAGHFLAWLVAGLMNSLFTFRVSFLVPAIVVLAFVPVVFFLLPGHVEKASARAKEERSGSYKTLFQMGFVWLLLLGAMNGFARDGVMAWGPSILAVNGQTGVSTTLLIPLLNLIGLVIGRFAYRAMNGRARAYCVMMCALCTVCCLLLPLTSGALMPALLLGVCCALMYAINPILTTLFPLEYDHLGLVGMTAGMLDSAIYLGSALAGVLGGTIKAANGWNGLYVSWAVAVLLGIGCCLLSSRQLKRYRQKTESVPIAQ